MEKLIIMDQIEKRIVEAKDGTIFVAQDFNDISTQETANKCLSRLLKQGQVRRIMQGIYYKPEFSSLINEYIYPSLDDVAFAIAKKYSWQIAPSGNKSLNLLGLSTQVPSKCIYMSSGPYKEYINIMDSGLSIVFKHTKQNDVCDMTLLSKIIIQALKCKGKDNIYKENIAHISNILTNKEKEVVLKETSKSTSWVYEFIKEICTT